MDLNEAHIKRYAMAYLSDLTRDENRELLTQGLGKRGRFTHTDQCGYRLDSAENLDMLLYFTLLGHVLGYADRGSGRIFTHNDPFLTSKGAPGHFTPALMQEVITPISQAIHCHGGEASVCAKAPASLQWYTDHFLPAVAEAAGTTFSLEEEPPEAPIQRRSSEVLSVSTPSSIEDVSSSTGMFGLDAVPSTRERATSHPFF